VRIVNETLAELKVEQHPDKTFVGRVSRGFEFLGYAITTPGIVGVAKKTLERFVERVTRLYEQGVDSIRIADYVRRWRVWVVSGLRGVACDGVGTNCHRSYRRRANSM
jgi:RNA-directed DNA polymerase